MSDFLAGLLTGLAATTAAALASAYWEPVQRWVASRGRRTFDATGLRVHVETDPAVIWAGMPDWEGFHFHLPQEAELCAPPANPREWHSWVVERGGWDLAESVVRLTITATAPTTVVIETPIVRASTAPLPPGPDLVHSVGGADITPRAFYVDLDTFGPESPLVTLADSDGDQSLPRSYSLKKDEVEQFLIRVAHSQPVLTIWTARIPVIVDGQREYLEIDNHGDGYVFSGGAMGGGLHWTGEAWVPLHRRD